MWEDETCKDGGRWSLRCPKSYTNKYWEDLLLALIGEQFEAENEVLGLVISIKPNFDAISVWNKSGKDQAKIDSIKKDLERILDLQEDIKLEYENFQEVLSRPKQEKPAYNTFTRNQGEPREEQNFEQRQISRGGGFNRGRGRGRGTQ